MVLVPAHTTFASRKAPCFYFPIPLFPFPNHKESQLVLQGKVRYSYYTFRSVRLKEVTICTFTILLLFDIPVFSLSWSLSDIQ